jgi:hypothetical protein
MIFGGFQLRFGMEHVSKQETPASYCHKCNFKTKTEGKLTDHVAKHERHASFCDNCNFETKP